MSNGKKTLTEKRIIDFIAAQSKKLPQNKTLTGIGDDCAVIPPGSQNLIVTTDSMTEGIHFKTFYPGEPHPEKYIGRKLAAINFSDIAAMGGRPLYMILSLNIPRSFSEESLKKIISGIVAGCREYGAALIGGDTTASKAQLTLTAAVIGTLYGKLAWHRNTARPGDYIYITGTPGYSAAGLYQLNKGGTVTGSFIQAHLNPKPRLHTARALYKTGAVASMIDISDGISQDLFRLITASKVGAAISIESMPSYKKLYKQFGSKAFDFVLNGGEDYELLFTAKKPFDDTMIKTLYRNTKVPIHCIGKIIKEKKMYYEKGTQRHIIKPDGFSHFH